MRLLISLGSYKQVWTSTKACELAATYIKKRYPKWETETCPIADGGRNSLAIINNKLPNLERINVLTVNHLGKRIKATYLLEHKLDARVAYIELAQSAGIHLETHNKPLNANTYGVGLIIKHAVVKKSAAKIVLLVGDSATTDCGVGILQALGMKFIKTNVNNLTSDFKPTELIHVTSFKHSHLSRQFLNKQIILEVWCDGRSSLLGEDGCWHRIAGKGGTKKDIAIMSFCVEKFAYKMGCLMGKNIGHHAMTGCAGGTSWGLKHFLEAKLKLGVKEIVNLINIDQKISRADLIMTGEGILDESTLSGKGPYWIVKKAVRLHKPCMYICAKSTLNVDLAHVHIVEMQSSPLDSNSIKIKSLNRILDKCVSVSQT